jgi:hypothetical protein
MPHTVLIVKSPRIVLSQNLANLPSLLPVPPSSEKGRREAKEVATFVRALYAESGFSSWGEFARSAGVAAATMSDWQRGENQPNGHSLLKLIRAANWSEESSSGLLGGVEEKVDAALVGIADILDLLRGAQGESGSASPKATPQ